jgi:hypothetical protein
MSIAQRVEKAVLLIVLVFLPTCVSAQSFHIVSQEGYAAASAFVSSQEGSTSDSEENPVPNTNPIDVFADATASLEGVSASANARLTASFAPTLIMISGGMDSNGSVSNTIEQSAGGTGSALLRTKFTVDAPALLTLTGEAQRSSSGGASVETNIVLRSATETLADFSSIDGMFEFQGLLQPGETYTFDAYGIANGVTSQDVSFISAQGSFNLNLAVAPVPAPGALLTALVGIVPGVSLLLRRRR